MNESSKVSAAANVIRHLSIEDFEKNLNDMKQLLCDDKLAVDELCQMIHCPLGEAVDTTSSKKYILSEYNRFHSSYRSPFSNQFLPEIINEEAADHNVVQPTGELRSLEITANDIFESYAHLYYGKDVITSVYLWNKDNHHNTTKGFSGIFLVKKEVKECDEDDIQGIWNSFHLVHVTVLSEDQAKYDVSSTILLSIQSSTHKDPIQMGGSVSKHIEKVCNFKNDSHHIQNIGHIIEDLEIELRTTVDSLYIQKNKEIVNTIRSEEAKVKKDERKQGLMMGVIGKNGTPSELQAAMMASLKKRMG